MTLVHKRDELRSGPHFNRYIIQRKHTINAEKLSIFLTIKIMRITFVSNERTHWTHNPFCLHLWHKNSELCIFFNGKNVCVSARLKAVIAAWIALFATLFPFFWFVIKKKLRFLSNDKATDPGRRYQAIRCLSIIAMGIEHTFFSSLFQHLNV